MQTQPQTDLRGALETAVRTLKFLQFRASIGTLPLAQVNGFVTECEQALQGGK